MEARVANSFLVSFFHSLLLSSNKFDNCAFGYYAERNSDRHIDFHGNCNFHLHLHIHIHFHLHTFFIFLTNQHFNFYIYLYSIPNTTANNESIHAALRRSTTSLSFCNLCEQFRLVYKRIATAHVAREPLLASLRRRQSHDHKLHQRQQQRHSCCAVFWLSCTERFRKRRSSRHAIAHRKQHSAGVAVHSARGVFESDAAV